MVILITVGQTVLVVFVARYWCFVFLEFYDFRFCSGVTLGVRVVCKDICR